METVIWRDGTGAILKHPPRFQVQLVTQPYGHQKLAAGEDCTIKRKKIRKRALNRGEEQQAKHFKEIRESLLASAESLINIGHKLGYFPIQDQSQATTTVVRDATVDWVGLCELDKIVPVPEQLKVLQVTQEDAGSDIDVFGNIVHNMESCDTHVTVCGCNVVIPSCSTFLLSDICKVELLMRFSAMRGVAYNAIVLDPPWENRSAIRGRKYKWLDKEDILGLPVPQLLAPDGLVAIWVTNKRQLVEWVINNLLLHWRLQFVGEWTWVKVTTDCDFVFDFDSVHKKPYESIILARSNAVDSCDTEPPRAKVARSAGSLCVKDIKSTCRESMSTSSHIPNSTLSTEPVPNSTVSSESVPNSTASSESVPNSTVSSKSASNSTASSESIESRSISSANCDIPSRYTIVCVPSTVHSQKPYLGDLLQYYIKGELKGLELFARNLLPGWTSWGNEVLQFQAMNIDDHT